MPNESVEAMIRYEHYIDGVAVAPSSGEFLPTENPYTGKVWAEIARGNRSDAEAAVTAAQRAFSSGPWPALTPSERGRMLWRLGDLVVAHAPRLAEIEQRDNGKLAAEVVTQVRYMGDYFRYYAGLADKVQSAVIPTDKKGVFAYTRYEPKGVVAIITPWNSPLTLTSWKLAPALAAGCTVVIKPSEFTSASMIELAKLFTEAGFPNGVVNVVTGLGPEVGEALVTHPAVAHIGFTGGSAAGRKIYELAARNFKTVTLELGGKSPNIVFDDADLEQAVKGVVSGIFAATGQSCQAGSRLLVQRSIHDAFVAKLIDFMKDVKLGDPTERRHPDRADRDAAAVREDPRRTSRSRKPRARRCALGGRSRPDLGAGLFVEPTIFTGVEQQHADRAGGSVRAGALGDPVRQTRTTRSRIANDVRLRPRRGGVDARPAPRHDDGREAPGRHGVGQQLPRDQLHVAVRRLQGIRHRP